MFASEEEGQGRRINQDQPLEAADLGKGGSEQGGGEWGRGERNVEKAFAKPCSHLFDQIQDLVGRSGLGRTEQNTGVWAPAYEE